MQIKESYESKFVEKIIVIINVQQLKYVRNEWKLR